MPIGQIRQRIPFTDEDAKRTERALESIADRIWGFQHPEKYFIIKSYNTRKGNLWYQVRLGAMVRQWLEDNEKEFLSNWRTYQHRVYVSGKLLSIIILKWTKCKDE